MRKFIAFFVVIVMMTLSIFSQGTDNIVKAVFVDEHGMKWFGTARGLVRFDGANWIDYSSHAKIPADISDIEYQSSDYGPEMWIGSGDHGVSVVAYNVDGITAATNYTMKNSGILSDSILDIVVDENNIRYFATPEGLGIFNNNTWSYISKGTYIPNAAVLSLGIKNGHDLHGFRWERCRQGYQG